MSLILNALKRAEKQRGPAEGSGSKPLFNPLVVESKGGVLQKKKLPLILIGLLLAGGVTGYLGMGIAKKILGIDGQTPSENEQATAPQQTPQEIAAGIKEEAIKAYQEGNFDLSRQKWEALVNLTPTDSEVYNNLGVSLKKLGKKEEAQQAYRTALSLNSSYPEALNNLGVLLLEKLMADEARQLFEKAIQINPQYPDPHFHLALIFEEKKELSEALEKFQTYLNLSKDLDPEMKNKIEMRMVSLQNF